MSSISTYTHKNIHLVFKRWLWKNEIIFIIVTYCFFIFVSSNILHIDVINIINVCCFLLCTFSYTTFSFNPSIFNISFFWFFTLKLLDSLWTRYMLGNLYEIWSIYIYVCVFISYQELLIIWKIFASQFWITSFPTNTNIKTIFKIYLQVGHLWVN